MIKTHQDTTAKYPIKRVEMKYFTRSAGTQDLSENNVSNGILPRRVIFAMVDASSFNGNYQKCPFKFDPFNIERAVLRVGGHATPYDSLEFNMSKQSSIYGRLC